MIKRLTFAFVFFAIVSPLSAFAAISQSEAQPPGSCEQTCRNTAYASKCAPGGVLAGSNIDPQCSQSRLGVPTYTAELTTYGNTNGCTDSSSNFTPAGVEKCSSGSCTTYNGQPVMGIAHRTFPMGTRMEVCNLKNQICAIATVVDRGPADYLGKRTIDAYSVLSAALQMRCGTAPATYKVLSGPGISGEVQPSGPTTPGIEAILAAQRNGNGAPVQGMTYQAMQTPWGYGYVGTPPPVGSNAYSSFGTPGYSSPYNQTYQQPYQQQQYTDPYGEYTNAGTGIPGAPAMDVKVWPHTFIQGQTVLVYWTSVNMPANACQVIFQNQLLAEGNSGSKKFKTTSFDTTTLTFTLRCADQNGKAYTASDSATLQ